VGARTALSTQATGITSFSDFALGEGTADLAVTVDDGQTSVVAGTAGYAYTITVTNGGPSAASGVTLADSWPAGFSQGAVSPSQGTCSLVGPGPDVSCALGPLAAGASAVVTIPYSVPAATPAGPQTAAVASSSATADLDAANDAASDTTTVLVAAPSPTPRPSTSPGPTRSTTATLPASDTRPSSGPAGTVPTLAAVIGMLFATVLILLGTRRRAPR
jgi:uncharacterized repeat protein (TIGR01451 family)